MSLVSHLRTSSLSAAADAAAAIDRGWTVSEFRQGSVAELLRSYETRLEQLRPMTTADARQLALSTEELLVGLREVAGVTVAWVRGSAEEHFLIFCESEQMRPIGCLRVMGKFDVPPGQRESFWSTLWPLVKEVLVWVAIALVLFLTVVWFSS